MKHALVLLFSLLSMAVLAEKIKSEDIGKVIFDSRRTELIQAQQAEGEKKYKSAAKKYRKLAEKVDARDIQASLFLQEALCWKRAGKVHDAYECYKNTIQQYPLYISYDEVVPQLRELAQAFVDGNGTFLGLRDKETAIAIYKLIILETPANNDSPKDRTNMAKLQVEVGKVEEAINTYADLLRNYPQNHDARLEMTQLLMDLSRKSDGDGSRLRAAERHAKIILEQNPNYSRKEEAQALIEEAREREAQRMLDMAYFYLRKSHYRPEAAKRYINELILQYQGSSQAWKAKRLLDEHPAFKQKEKEEAVPNEKSK